MKILCPFCFKDFDSESMELMCENKSCYDTNIVPIKDDDGNDTGNTREERVINQKYFEYSKKKTPTNHVYKPRKEGFIFKKLVTTCDKCGSDGTYVCPCCNNILPTEMSEKGSEIISVIGGPGSGKTNYIISLIHQMQKYGHKVGLRRIRPYNRVISGKATDARFSEMKSVLFGDRPEPLAKTDVNAENKNPWIFALESTTGKTIFLVFDDSAGENFVDSDKIRDNASYLNKSAAIFLMLDTCKVKKIKKILEEKQMIDTSIGNKGEEFDKALENFLNFAKDKADAKTVFQKPIAFVLSKFDIVKDNQEEFDAALQGFDDNSSFIKTGKFDIDEIDNCSQSIKSYLDDVCDEGQVVGVVFGEGRWNEDNAKFFGVSALGQNPIKGNKLTSDVKPYRVMDPIIWILSRIGGFGI